MLVQNQKSLVTKHINIFRVSSISFLLFKEKSKKSSIRKRKNQTKHDYFLILKKYMSMHNQLICKQCWRPTLIEYESHFYCPACGTQLDKNFNIIQNPNPDDYSNYAVLLIEKILNKENGYRIENFNLLLNDLGLNEQSSSFSWFIATHHLEILYSHYELITQSKQGDTSYPLSFPRPSPKSQRAYTGEFNDYEYIFYRLDNSPFKSLSDDSFQIIYNPVVISTLPFPLSYIKTRKNGKKYFSFDDYKHTSFSYKKWRNCINELIDSGLIKAAPINENLELVPINNIRRELKKFGIKEVGRTRKEVADNAINYLPENTLFSLVDNKRAFFPTKKTINEFRLIIYGVRNLHDETRQYNLFVTRQVEKNITCEMYIREFGFPKEPKSFLEILIEIIKCGINSKDYKEFLAKGNRPLEALSGYILAQLGYFEKALERITIAYEHDIKNNDVSSSININHFSSLKRIQLQIELIKSLTEPKFMLQAASTEDILEMWISLYKRISDEGSTSFLFEFFQEIFNSFGCLSRDCENKFREKVGVPRIGEGWVSEMELLNIIKEIFPKDTVVHQASPEWLGLQRFDIYLPKRKLAIEYQGLQHYEPVDFFGGLDGFLKTQNRDRKKAELCKKNNVTLVYFNHDEPISFHFVMKKLKSISIL